MRKKYDHHDQQGATRAGQGRPAVPRESANALWVVDFAYVHTRAGLVCDAFVIAAYARRIVGWKAGTFGHGGLRARFLGTGDPRPQARPRGRIDPPRRKGRSISRQELHPAPGRTSSMAQGSRAIEPSANHPIVTVRHSFGPSLRNRPKHKALNATPGITRGTTTCAGAN